MPTNKYTGTLTFKVGSKDDTAEVTIFTSERDAAAGGGYECMVAVKHRDTEHHGGFWINGSVIRDKFLINGLQEALKSMPKPLRTVDVRRADFKPQLVKQ